MKIAVIGIGYVGLTLACLADFGNELVFVGRTKSKAEMVNSGKSPIYEPRLDEVIERNVKRGSIKATTDYENAMDSELVFICVGTPSQTDGSIDLSQIKDASRKVGGILKESDYKTIVVKSTVVPGTTKNVVKKEIESSSSKVAGTEFGLCMNPEFLKEGSSVQDFLKPDKVVVGQYDEKSGSAPIELYKFYDNNVPRIITDLNTAEMIKYAQNAALASRISFINEIANICEKFNVDVKEIASAIGLDSRIGSKFLNAGVGFGGSCFPKDVKALLAAAKSVGAEPTMLKAILDVNARQPYRMIELAKQTLGNLEGKKIAILGLAFKDNTDDMREASSIPIINSLLKEKAIVKVYDPQAVENAKKIFGETVEYCSTKEECIKGADLCMVVTEWKEFKEMDLSIIKCPIIDGRRILDSNKVLEFGMPYKGIGWKENLPQI